MALGTGLSERIQSQPPAVRKTLRISLWCISGGFFVVILGYAGQFAGVIPRKTIFTTAIQFSHVVGIGFAGIYSWWTLRNMRKQLKTYGKTICTTCLYPLAELQNTDTCPECGESFGNLKRVEECWRRWERGG